MAFGGLLSFTSHFSRYLVLWFWSWHHADLLEKADHVLLRPFLDQPAIGNPMNRDGRHSHVISGLRRAGQIPLMFTVRGQASDDLISLGNLIFDVMIARSRVPEELKFAF